MPQPLSTKDRSIAKISLWLLLLFTGIYFILAHEGLYYSDDLHYSHYAAQILEGEFNIADPGGHTFIHRLAVFAPTALLYAVGGIHKITYTLWPLLCTLGCLVLVYLALSKTDSIATAFALCFLALSFYFIFFSTFLYPDNIVAFFALAAVFILYKYKDRGFSPTLLQAAGFALCLFLAFLAKETVIFILPFLVLKLAQDLYFKRNHSFWIGACVSGFILGTAYLTWYYTETGNALYRFTEIERANLAYQNHVTNPEKPLLFRLTLEPLLILMETGIFPLVLFLFGGINQEHLRQMKGKGFWVVLFLTSLATFWFTSTSYTRYNPISLDARMFNLLLPPLAIAAAWGFQYKLRNWRYTLMYTLVFLLIAFYPRNNQSLVYGLLGLYFAVHTGLLLYQKEVSYKLTVLALAAIFAIRPVYFMFKPKTLYYQENLAALKSIYDNSPEAATLVLVPDYLHDAAPFYSGYQPDSLVTFQPHGRPYPATGYKRVFLLENTGVTDQPSFAGTLPTDSLQALYPQRSLVKQFGPLRLYRLK